MWNSQWFSPIEMKRLGQQVKTFVLIADYFVFSNTE
jgi:hypothetical protein